MRYCDYKPRERLTRRVAHFYESRNLIGYQLTPWGFLKLITLVPDLTETGSISPKIENIAYLKSLSGSTRISQYLPSCGHCNNGIPHAGGNTFERGSLNIFLSIKHSSSKYNHTKAKRKQNKSEL